METPERSYAEYIAAVDTLLYSLEDSIEAIAEAVHKRTSELADAAMEPIVPVAMRAFEYAQVNAPDDDEDGPLDWTPMYRLSESLFSDMTAAESQIDAVAARAIGHSDQLAARLLPSTPDFIAKGIQLLGDLIGGLLGNLETSPDLWREMAEAFRVHVIEHKSGLIEMLAELSKGTSERWGADYARSNPMMARLQRAEPAPGMPPPDAVGDMIAWDAARAPWLRALIDVTSGILSTFSLLGAVQAGNVSTITQGSMARTTPTPLSSGEAAELVHRGDVTAEWAKSHVARLGLSPELFDLKYKLGRRFMTVDNIVEMWRRTGDDNQLADLFRMGFSEHDVDRIRSLALSIPTPSDVVRFMARDAYDDALAQVTGVDTDFASKVKPDEFRKSGVDIETAKLYWRAHWRLPSPTQLFEFHHRTNFTQAQIAEALKADDYAPGYIQHYIDISYNPPGRIDLRRMWETGVITTRAELVERHKHLGYSPTDADVLATFVETLTDQKRANEAERDRAPIVAALVRAYANGTMSAAEAETALVGLGLSSNEAQYKLQEGTLARLRDRSERIQNAVGREYVRGFATREDTYNRLIGYGFDAAEIDSLLDSWDLDRELREMTDEERHQRDLSKSEIIASYNEHILQRDTVLRMLQDIGYDATESEALVALEDAQAARAEAKVIEAALHTQYVNRFAEAQEVVNTLVGFGYGTERIAALMSRWEVEREVKRPKVTTAQLEKMLMQGIVPLERVEAELRQRGYSDEDVTLLSTLYGTDMSIARETLDERIRQFNIREARVTRQGDARIGLQERGLDIRETQFDRAQEGLQERFDSGQEQQRNLQRERLSSQREAQNARLAAQTARDASAFAERRASQERTIAASTERLEKQLANATARFSAADATRRELAAAADATRRDALAATDARQARTLQAQAERQDRALAAAIQRQQTAAQIQSQLQAQRADSQRELQQLRTEAQAARDIVQNARRIEAESRAEATRVRTEERGAARTDIRSAEAAALRATTDAILFERESAIAEINARFAALNASAADARRSAALELRLDAEQRLASSTPTSQLLNPAGF